MKRLCLLLMVLGAVAMAQEQTMGAAAQEITNLVVRPPAPTYSDMYCAGFVSKASMNKANVVLAGMNSPNAGLFATGDTIFLAGGGYQEGNRYSIVRLLRDPNKYQPYPGQRMDMATAGEAYADVGHVRVVSVRGSVAIAAVEFSCSALTKGDLVIPYEEKPSLVYRKDPPFDRFPTGGGVSGRIIMAKEYDTVVASGHKVYLNIGADKGLKPGDYLRAVRSYDPGAIDQVDALSYKMPPGEDTQKNKAKVARAEYQKLPIRALGEMIVLSVNATSATAMITRSPESINVGDAVQVEASQQ